MKRIDLSGNWRYTIEDNVSFSLPEFDASAWNPMHIPLNWFLGGLDHHGVVWFRYEFKYGRRQAQTYTTLHFDGVDYSAEVYLNGKHLGLHTGYFTPFAFDVTETLKPGKNILAVRVDSPYEPPRRDGWYMRKKLIKGVLNHHDCRPGGAWEPTGQSYNTGGIWNRVYLEDHGAVTIEQMLLRADLESQPPIFHVDLSVRNRAPAQQAALQVRCEPQNFEGKEFKSEFSLNIPTGDSHHHIQLDVPGVEWWYPWDRGNPNLYTVTLTLDKADYKHVFGFRTIRMDEDYHWYINGKRLFLRGSNYIPSQWLSETLFPEAAGVRGHPFGGGPSGKRYERDVTLMKRAYLNIIRVHALVLPQEFYEVCDQAGVLVWQDFPLQWGYSPERAFQAEAEGQITDMVTILFNHPSIVAWCCHNESPWDSPWMAPGAGESYNPDHNRALDELLVQTVKTIDSTRYVHENSGTGDGHAYPGWYSGKIEDYRNLPGAPFITEYGAQGLPIKESLQRIFRVIGPDAGQHELSLFKAWVDSRGEQRPANKYLTQVGTALWNFTDKVRILRFLQKPLSGLGINVEHSPYRKLPSVPETTGYEYLRLPHQVWEQWLFHNFQPPEAFVPGRVNMGSSLDEFIASSQAYQSHLLQFGTEAYRRGKASRVTGIFQFYFNDPWPAISFSLVDYWRKPKPAYEVLCRSMQPVLPSVDLPERIPAQSSSKVSLVIVNDLDEHFANSKIEWKLEKEKTITSGEWTLDIPADDVSPASELFLPGLMAGNYRLTVSITADNGKPISENFYEVTVA